MKTKAPTLLVGLPAGTHMSEVQAVTRLLTEHFDGHHILVVAGLQYVKVVEP